VYRASIFIGYSRGICPQTLIPSAMLFTSDFSIPRRRVETDMPNLLLLSLSSFIDSVAAPGQNWFVSRGEPVSGSVS